MCRQGRQEIGNEAVPLLSIPTLKFAAKVGTISRVENLDRSFCVVPFLRPCEPVLGARYICSHRHYSGVVLYASFIHIDFDHGIDEG